MEPNNEDTKVQETRILINTIKDQFEKSLTEVQLNLKQEAETAKRQSTLASESFIFSLSKPQLSLYQQYKEQTKALKQSLRKNKQQKRNKITQNKQRNKSKEIKAKK